MLTVATLTFGLVAAATASFSTHNSELISVEATNGNQIEFLKTVRENDWGLDFWTHPHLGAATDIMVPKARFQEVKAAFEAQGLTVKIDKPDLESFMYEMMIDDAGLLMSPAGHAHPETTLNHHAYRSYQEYIDGLKELSNAFPDLVRFDPTARRPVRREQSVEGRDIHVVELTSKKCPCDDNESGGKSRESREFESRAGGRRGRCRCKPVVMHEVNIHAREWITSASAFYMVDWLATSYKTSDDARFLLDNFHLVVIPVANPDGYEFSRAAKENRFWRKNRKVVNENCTGIDLNRNFDANWAPLPYDPYCPSDVWPGLEAGSEPETRAVGQIYKRFRSKMALYFSVHSYSQLLLLPFANRNSTTPVNQRHVDVGAAMEAAMEKQSGLEWVAGTPMAAINYTGTGTSLDYGYMQSRDQSAVSVIFELRPAPGSGWGGFVLPASEIVPSGKDLLAGTVAAARVVAAETRGDDDDNDDDD